MWGEEGRGILKLLTKLKYAVVYEETAGLAPSLRDCIEEGLPD